jgi:hypothetical protein
MNPGSKMPAAAREFASSKARALLILPPAAKKILPEGWFWRALMH